MTHRITVTLLDYREVATCSCGEQSEPLADRRELSEWARVHLGYPEVADDAGFIFAVRLVLMEQRGELIFPAVRRTVRVCSDRCPCGGQIVSGGEDEDRCTRCGPVGSRWAPVG